MLTESKIRKIVGDYDALYDEIMEYAKKRYLPRDTDRYYLVDLHFNFYKERTVSVIEKDAADENYFEERTFPLSAFIEYYKKKIEGKNEFSQI